MDLDGNPLPGASAAQQTLLQQQQTIQALQQQLQQQQQQQQYAQPLAAHALPHRIVATIGHLEPFTGRGSSSAAQQWLKKVEYRFLVAESMLDVAGTPQAAGARFLATAEALTDDADRWFSALPIAPTTWADFRVVFLRRFVSVATTDAKITELQRLVHTAQRMRERLNVDGLRRYATQFMQLAGEIPTEVMSDYLKRKAFAEGLPQKHAEYALSRNRNDNPPELHTLVDDILARALDRAMSTAAMGGHSSASGTSDAMQLDAISLCAAQFGVSREEAARYVEPGEGWAVHDTDSHFPAPRPTPSPTSSSSDGMEERMLAMFQRLHSAGAVSSGSQGKPQSTRRHVPSGVRDEVPEDLAKARRTAGLCIKCGIAKYEGGGKGHNSRTCQASADKTTSAAEGKKKAGF
jgi:hypothetical protein